MASKRCTRCGRDLPSTKRYFHADAWSADGLTYQCKICRASPRPKVSLDDGQRFLLRVHLRPDGCWEWTGGTNGRHRYIGAYGRFEGSDGKNYMAHRYAYELLVGPLPDGMHIDHLCQNKRCVNPDHLAVVTPEENIRRSHFFQHRYANKLTRDQIVEAGELRRQGETWAAISRRFGVSRTCVRESVERQGVAHGTDS